MDTSELFPATIAEANAAILLLREQGSMIAAEAVEKLLQHCGKPALRPNAMRCAKCRLRVTGALTAAACPNGCGPLWAATWEEECLTAERDRDEFLQIAQRIAIEKAELRREADRLRKCANCQGSRIAPIGDGYSVNPCPDCAQSPAKLTRVEIDRIAQYAIDSDHLAKEEWESAGLYDFAHAVSGGIGVVDDLAAFVRRLAHALKNAKPDNSLAGSALDFLKRHGLDSSPLRVEYQNEGESK